ncbi:hypothetical protein BH11MYX1_BH11MYX1_50380 [soil metagenome]
MRVLFLLASLSACGTAGAFHQATLMGQCATDDAACSRRHPVAPIAIGARFHPEVEAELAGSTTPNLRLESAAADVLAIEGDALIAKKAGTSAVLITTDDGSVVDFVQMWVAPITTISLARRDGDRLTGAVGLAVGEDLIIAPALWHDAQRLAGEADLAWTSSNPATLELMRDGSMDRRRLRARVPGKTTVTVALGETQTSIEVEVLP